METLHVFSDTPFPEKAALILAQGLSAHRLIIPAKRPASVLSAPEPDPSFPLADIAFGQPDLVSIANSPRLKWIHVSSAGFTRYDTPEFREMASSRGIQLTNSSSVYAAACAEHALSFMLAQSRRLPQALASQTPNASPEWFQLRSDSISLRGQNLVILGYGGIASSLLSLLAPFAMNACALRRSPRGDEKCPTISLEMLPAALAAADHVVNILPENPSSRHFIDATRLAQMKSGAVLYNIGRGSTIDQDALLAALQTQHLAAAWLDVTDPEPLPATHPLRTQPNCFITPHTAGGHADESSTLVRHFLANFSRYLAGLPLLDQVI